MIMLAFFLFTLTAILVHAQQNQQTPLREDQHNPVIPLTLGNDRTYTFESALDDAKRLSLKAITGVERYRENKPGLQSALFNIPLDYTQSGALVFDPTASWNAYAQQNIAWTDTPIPGEDVPISYVGIRKGAMISMGAYATRLALETPYISLPNEIYDVLVQATKPAPHQHDTGYDDVVDCGLLERYPVLALGLHPKVAAAEDDEEDIWEELVITPQQYIMQTEEGQCILLVRRDRTEVVLGWAAVRGREVVLDWANARTGFGR